MPLFALDTPFLAPLLEDWRLRLTSWARSGALSRAAVEALGLPEEPETLRQLQERWAAGDWRELPPVERLPASAMPAAAGAYVMATGTIFLNPAWLDAASREAALAVLTEELGHHLDGLLNGGDAPGDEGELFAALLHGDGIISAQRRQRLRRENDSSTLLVESQVLEVEQSNPPPPLVASFQGLRSPLDVRVVGNHAYIADYSLSTSDLKIINIGNPSAPVLLSQFNGTDIISDIDFVNGHVYAADGASGLRVISVSNPSSPSLKSTYNSPGDSQDVKVVGNFAYVADGTSGLQIVNISNPNSPVLQGNAPAPDDATGIKGVVSGVDIVGNLAYVISNRRRAGLGELQVFNVSNPAAPVQLGRSSFQLSSLDLLYNVQVVGQYAYIAAGSKGLKIIDISDPAVPVLKGEYYYNSDQRAYDVQVVGKYAFVAYDLYGLEIIDVSNPSSPILLSYYDPSIKNFGLPVTSTVTSVEVASDYAYLTVRAAKDLGGLWILNVSQYTQINDSQSVTLSLSSDGVSEDGPANLVYTFSRAGSTASALTVNYTVSGSARLVPAGSDPSDYTVLGGPSGATSRTVIFAAGSATATVTIDPTTDADPELDETVVLSLAPGVGYTVGLQKNSATGTIRNDDTTIETRGTTTLLRRGDGVAIAKVSGGPAVQITSPWGAAVGSDTSAWQILAADTINGVNQLLWRNNSANFLHTWSLDANWTWTSSGGTFALNETPGWTLEASFQVDANNDGIIGAPFSTIEARGTTTLLRRPSDDQAFIQVGTGPRLQVTSPWGAAVGSNTSPWQIIAADTVNGVNQLLWRNNSANFLHTWSLDANWTWTSSGGTFDLNASAGWDLEASFQVDANNDGIIGAPFSTIEASGTTTLLSRPSDDQAFIQVGTGARLQVTSPWGAAVGSNTSPWQIIAADTVNGVNQLLWRNNTANFLHTWSLDANWTWTSSGGTFDPNASAGWDLEASFQVDANNDGIIGAPLSTIEARGTTSLLRRPSDDQAFVQVGSGPRTQVQSPWGATIGSNTSPWQMLAAETINGVNQVLWRNNSANVLHTWSLDANWNWTASNGTDAPTSPQGIALLNQFGLG